MRTWAISIFLVTMYAGAAHAEDTSGCGKFKWSIERERVLLREPKPISDGGEVVSGAAFRVSLVDTGKVAFAATPERAPKPNSRGAQLSFKVEKAGVYEVTLSDEGWIDIVSHGERVPSAAFSGQKGCPGVRKTVRFHLDSGDFVVQLSNIDGSTIDVAVVTAP